MCVTVADLINLDLINISGFLLDCIVTKKHEELLSFHFNPLYM